MEMIDSITFPNKDRIREGGFSSFYPLNIFYSNEFECMNLRDITILYGSNGSGKSTILKLIARKLDILNGNDFYREVIYGEAKGRWTTFAPF